MNDEDKRSKQIDAIIGFTEMFDEMLSENLALTFKNTSKRVSEIASLLESFGGSFSPDLFYMMIREFQMRAEYEIAGREIKILQTTIDRQKGGNSKRKNDKEGQARKAAIKGYWEEWQVKPHLYSNYSDFATRMLELFPDASHSTIEKKWIPAWNKSRK